jgi:hypothetical protein
MIKFTITIFSSNLLRKSDINYLFYLNLSLLIILIIFAALFFKNDSTSFSFKIISIFFFVFVAIFLNKLSSEEARASMKSITFLEARFTSIILTRLGFLF